MPDLEQRIARMEKMISFLVREKNKETKENEWIPEKEAAKLLGLSDEYMRRQIKDGKIPVMYKHRNNRHFRYNLPQIKSFLNS